MRSTAFRTAVVLTALICLHSARGWAQRIISINVDESNGRVVMTNDVAGAPGVRVGHWNNYRAGNRTLPADVEFPVAGALVDSNGDEVSGFEVVVSGPQGWTSDDLSINDRRLYRGSHNINANSPTTQASMTVTFNNIPFRLYDLYVYAQGQTVSGDNFRGGSVQLGAGPIYYTQGASSPADDGTGYVIMTTTSIPDPPVESDIAFGNYIAFEDLTGDSQVLTLISYLWTDYARLQLYGFQVVEVPSSTATIVEVR